MEIDNSFSSSKALIIGENQAPEIQIHKQKTKKVDDGDRIYHVKKKRKKKEQKKREKIERIVPENGKERRRGFLKISWELNSTCGLK